MKTSPQARRETHASPKTDALDRARSDASGQPMTTNQGVAVGDNQHSCMRWPSEARPSARDSTRTPNSAPVLPRCWPAGWTRPFVLAPNLFAAMAGHEALVGLHSSLRTLAVSLNRIANDIRLMGSGPRAGLGELKLPANEPGSSMMPGKVNPTQVEALTMVCAQVMGHDVAIGIAASQGQFELNVYKPLIALNLQGSLRLLADAMESFRAHCIEGIEVDARRAESMVANSLMGVTALVPNIGYERASRVAHHAHAQGMALRRAAHEAGGFSEAEYDAWVDLRRMSMPG